MYKAKYHIAVISLAALLTGCVTPYTPAMVAGTSGILVVEGIITEGETIITLSESVGIQDDITDTRPITNATVTVLSDAGNVFTAGNGTEEGKYHISVGDLMDEAAYKLRIETDGRTYESSFLNPVSSSPVEVYLAKEAQGSPITVNISTVGSDNTSEYYMWTYMEDWEVTAALWANVGVIDGDSGFLIEGGGYNQVGEDPLQKKSLIQYYLTKEPRNPYYYCWKSAECDRLLLESTTPLSSNIIRDKTLFEFAPQSDRLSFLYRLSITQHAMHKGAYDYFETIRKNIETTGDLFAPIPSEIKGNITCIEDPNLPVIGYIDVSRSSSVTLFVEEDNEFYEKVEYSTPSDTGELSADSSVNCDPSTTMSLNYDYYLWEVPPGQTIPSSWAPPQFAHKRCVNCVEAGGTKNKPNSWPNDHI